MEKPKGGSGGFTGGENKSVGSPNSLQDKELSVYTTQILSQKMRFFVYI